MTRTLSKKSLIFLIFGLLVFIPSLITAICLFPISYDGEKRIVIQPGQKSSEIALNLEQNQIIRSNVFFNICYGIAYFFINKKPLISGEYVFSGNMGVLAVLDKIQNGRKVIRKLTIPEGWTVAQAADLLNQNKVLSGSCSAAPGEGCLLPQTYLYCFGDDRQKIMDRMRKAMDDKLEKIWAKARSKGILGGGIFKTPREILILASIVEKESAVKSERPRIAAVFLNRLRIGMPLQSDPTVIYAVTNGKYTLDRPLNRGDLNLDSPYNTYMVRGLPPEPIACPGEESLEAVINPEETDDLYFVADGNGGHNFSKTLAEHNVNVSRWRKNQQKMKESRNDLK